MFQRFSTVKELSGQLRSLAKSRGITKYSQSLRRYSNSLTTESKFRTYPTWTHLQTMSNQNYLQMTLPRIRDYHRTPYKSSAVEGLLSNSLLLMNKTQFDNSCGNSRKQNQKPQRNSNCGPKKDECAQEQEEWTVTPCCRPFKLQKEHPMKDSNKKRNNKC